MRNHAPLRVVLSVHHELDNNSGAAGAAIALKEALREFGHHVELISFDDFPRWISHLPAAIKIRLRPILFPWFIAFSLAPRLKSIDVIDLLSGDGWLLFSLVRLTKRSEHRPLLVSHSAGLEHVNFEALRNTRACSQRRGFLGWPGKLYEILYLNHLRLLEVTRSCRAAELCLFLNEYDRRYAIKRFFLNTAQTFIIKNGLPCELLSLGKPQRSVGARVSIAQIGSYVIGKGIFYGSKALCAVMEAFPQTHVHFIGTGCSRDRVLNDFPETLWHRITVVPYFERKELPRILLDSEIKLFPTLSEGFGMALLEAMACGLAPVTTAVPGPLQIVEPNVDALVVPPRDEQALTEALSLLLSEDELRYKIRMNAYHKAQGYTWTQIARERVEIYQKFLGGIDVYRKGEWQ